MWTSLLILTVLGAGLAQVNDQAIKDVAEGKLKEAKASWWGFSAENATACLQAAINSGCPKLIVDNVGKPWIVNPIQLASNQEVIFEPGVEVVAKKDSFRGGNDCLFTARLKENIVLRGDSAAPAVLRMHRDDYAKAPYTKAEWRHVLSLLSSRNIRVENLVLKESGGDGIYLGVAQRGISDTDIVIRNVTCDSNYRQGISVICAENLLIENCRLINTGGTAPMAGIDFEPNEDSERLVNCVMRDCITQGNRGCGYAFYIPTLTARSLPVSIRLENCQSISDGGHALALYTGNEPEKAVAGNIEFVGCTFAKCPNAGIVITNKPADRCPVLFRGCKVSEVAEGKTGQTPIVLIAGSGASQDMGGIRFEDCIVRDEEDRNPMSFADQTGFVALRDITGKITLERGGQPTEYELTPEVITRWMPTTPLKRIPVVSLKGLKLEPLLPEAGVKEFGMRGIRIRQAGEYVLYARADEQVRLRASYQPVARYSGTTMPVEVQDAEGKTIAQGSVPFGDEAEVTFKAPATGSYRIVIKPGLNYGQIVSSSHPLCLVGDREPIHFYGGAGELFFAIPGGTREVGVRVYGEGLAEGVKAELCDPEGKVVQTADDIARAHQFDLTMPEGFTGAVWSVRLSKPSKLYLEDNYLALLGVPPLVAPTREGLLGVKR